VPSAEEFVAEQGTHLLDAWPVGDERTDDDILRPLLQGVDALVRQGLREQCTGWPPDWSTDGIVAARCVRLDVGRLEVIGLCWSFAAMRGGFARFPVRATLEVDASRCLLVSFGCDVGEYDRVQDKPPDLPSETMILMAADADGVPQPELLVGRRLKAIEWTPVIAYDWS